MARTVHPSVYPCDPNDELEVRVIEELKRGVRRANACIYRIPTKVRRVNSHAYTPLRVGIGPYHGVKSTESHSPLKLMEPYKLTYLASLMLRSESPYTIYKEYMGAIESRVYDALGYYAGIQHLGLKEFKAMLLLDGAFVVEFFCRCMEAASSRSKVQLLQQIHNFFSKTQYHTHDPMLEQAMKHEVLRDLILLENQLPYFILETLFEVTFSGKRRPEQLTFGWIAYHSMDYLIPVGHGSDSKMLEVEELEKRIKDINKKVLHLLHLLRICCVHLAKPPGYWTDTLEPTRKRPNMKADHEFRCVTVTELLNVGVQFQMGNIKENLFDIDFDENTGKITLPSVFFNDTTETFFRNIMAFEQYYLDEYHISDYMCFMDRIVDGPGDVEILERNQIISNWLDTNKSVSKILNDMNGHTGITYGSQTKISKDMTAYVRKPWNRWKSMLRRDYFGSPWAIISFIAAFLLLSLTAIQTIAALRSTK